MISSSTMLKTYGPWALVTGASSGIGKEFAVQLAANGLNVVLIARRHALLEEVGQTIRRQCGVQYRVIAADLSEERSVEHIADRTGDLDIGLIVSNAGTGNPGEFLALEHDELTRVFRLNTLAHLNIAHRFGRRLAKRGRGGIILGGAMGAIHGIPFMANDAGSKAYVQSLGQSLRFEWKRDGVAVMVLVVPPTDTAILQKFGLDPATMPMKPMSTTQCVHEALGALLNRRSLCLPGQRNRLMSALIPKSVARAMMGRMIEKTLAGRTAMATHRR